MVVFGAGGRAGRRVVAEAASRGHEITAVVRDPVRHPGLAGARVRVVAGDVTDADRIAAVAGGQDAAVHVAARLDVPAESFFPAAARALVDGLARAGVARLVLAGIGTVLETAPGVAVHDAPDFPPGARAFSLGHAAELDVLRDKGSGLDWVVLAPPPTVLDDRAPRIGRYRIGGAQILSATAVLSYADLAVALVDEVETPKHHRALVALAPA